MIPTLLDATWNKFDFLDHIPGLPLLDSISCEITQELNGSYELRLVYKGDGKFAGYIEINQIIVARPNKYTMPQAFRIYRVIQSLHNGVFQIIVYAQHISYDLLNIPVLPPFSATTIDEFIEKIPKKLQRKSYNIDFQFYRTESNFLDSAEINIVFRNPTNVRSAIYGRDGFLSDFYNSWGTVANVDVRINNNRITFEDVAVTQDQGLKARKKIIYGVELTEFEIDDSALRSYSVVLPYALKDDEIIYIPSYINSEKLMYGEEYGQKSGYSGVGLRTNIVDVTSDIEGETTPDNVLYAGFKKIQKYIPEKIFSVNFVDLKTLDKEHSPNDIVLGDIVEVSVPRINKNWILHCVSQTFDVLSEKYISVKIGNK